MLKKIIALFIVFFSVNAIAQNKILTGIAKDAHSEEALPFATVGFKHTNINIITDSSGKFSFSYNHFPSDTLQITSVGYQPFYFSIPKNIDTISVNAMMNIGVAEVEVVVKAKAKHSRGWYLWKKVLLHKVDNNIFEKNNFSYHVYNRLELDINNINPNKVQRNKLLKPFSTIIANNIDTLSEEKPILPTFFSETISDYYFQKNPNKTREIIIANKISGVKNESVTKYLGAINQNVVIYGNFIPVFDKDFVSPFNDNGDAYYNYKLADTQYISNRRLLHLIFIPKHSGQNTFTGDCWINDTTFAVQRILLHLSKDANINFVEKLSLVQEYKPLNDSVWFLSKDKFYVTLNPIGNNNLGFIAKKTANYEKAVFNTNEVTTKLLKNKTTAEVQVAGNARIQQDAYWDTARLEKLTNTETGIYKMIDTLQNLPAFAKFYNTLYFLGTGYKNIGNLQIGPWLSWISSNAIEGTRLRFDLGTNKGFNRNLYLHGYLAYGFSDKRWKGKAEALYFFNRNPWQNILVSYKNDLDFSQNYNSNATTDNALSAVFRKSGIPIKFINIKETKVQYFKDTKIGLSFTVSVANKIYDPLLNLPSKVLADDSSSIFNTTEVKLKVRLGYLEKFYENLFFRYNLSSPYPIPEIEFTEGVKNMLNSQYSYQKVKFSVSQSFSIAPYGKIDYYFFVGKIFGTLPYPLLEVHPGNEVYFYNKQAFNLMNKYEYVSDKYAGFNVEHNVGNGLFRYIPITRKLKFRQFWNIRGVIGNVSNENKQLNQIDLKAISSLDNKLYLEVGTGVDNIFKLFRIDFVWRLAPTPLPSNASSRFGIFGSFKLQL